MTKQVLLGSVGLKSSLEPFLRLSRTSPWASMFCYPLRKRRPSRTSHGSLGKKKSAAGTSAPQGFQTQMSQDSETWPSPALPVGTLDFLTSPAPSNSTSERCYVNLPSFQFFIVFLCRLYTCQSLHMCDYFQNLLKALEHSVITLPTICVVHRCSPGQSFH